MSRHPCLRLANLQVRELYLKLIYSDSPTKIALERRTLASQFEDILEIEVVSTPEPELDEDPHGVDESMSTNDNEQKTPIPLTLGGSKFRRKPVHVDSSPITSNPPLTEIINFEESVVGSLSMPSPQIATSTSVPIIEAGNRQSFTGRTSLGRQVTLRRKPQWKKLIAKQNRRNAMKAQKDSYYGVDIHGLLNRIESASQFPSQAEYTLFISRLSRYDDGPREVSSKELWTDKYRATKFVDLLGDERVHRDIMRWLKHWDYCVFGRDIPTSSSYQPRQPLNDSRKFGAVSNAIVTDPYHRPPQKILMLHGPPGLGKTTLAHVAASLAGYEVYEINASDDRSGTAARDRIVEAVETLGIDRSGRRGKERCVILDECDGGDANFIRVLLDLLQADEKAGGPQPKHINGKKRKPRKPLLRPIICICNDLYLTLLKYIDVDMLQRCDLYGLIAMFCIFDQHFHLHCCLAFRKSAP
jgi:hypothetical protein